MGMVPRDARLRAVVAFYAIGLALLFLYLIREIITIAFVAWIIAAAVRPAADKLDRRLPRALAIFIPYLALLGFVVVIGLLVVPPFVAEFRALGTSLPTYVDQAQSTIHGIEAWIESYGVPNPLREQAAEFSRWAQQAAMFLVRLPFLALNALVGTFAVIAIGFYWLLNREQTVTWLCELLRPGAPARARALFDLAEAQMGAYVRGLLILGVTIGVVTLVGLLALRVPYAVVLAVVAGILELLPTIGPIISSIPAILAALTISPVLAIGVAVMYFAVQQLENYVLVPRVHHESVGLPALAILLAVLIGSTIGGLAGAILAVPVAALIALLLEDIRRPPEELAEAPAEAAS